MLNCNQCGREFTHRRYLLSHSTRVHILSKSQSRSDEFNPDDPVPSVLNSYDALDYTRDHHTTSAGGVGDPSVFGTAEDLTSSILKEMFNFYSAFEDTTTSIFNKPLSLSPAWYLIP